VGVNAGAASDASLTTRSTSPATAQLVVVVAVFLTIVLAATVLPFVSSIPMPPWVTPLDQLLRLATSLLWLAALVISWARYPDNPIWKLILAFNVVAQISRVYVLGDSVVFSLVLLLGNLGLAVYIHLVIAFPSGRLRGRFDRRLVAFTYGYILVAGVLGTLAGRDWAAVRPFVQNVLALWPNDEALVIGGRIEAMIGAAVCVVVPLTVWHHWRDASPAGRRPLLPIVLSAPLMFAGIAIANVGAAFEFEVPQLLPDPWWIAAVPVQFIIPAGVLLGVLRMRLRRGRVADLVVQLGRGVAVGGLQDVLARALGDPSLELVFPAPSGDGFVDATGRPVGSPVAGPTRAVTRLETDGELLGLIVHDPALVAEDPGLVEAVGTAARLALENERLTAQVKAQLDEVRASRARIIEAGDAERRRVERDLHDGAQQRLVALALRLQTAKGSAVDGTSVLDEAAAELDAAIGEVRTLARGLHPAILTESGLAAAVDVLAERAPVPVMVDVPDRRYEPSLESTAYFVIAEALTNIQRYADATEAHVRVRDDLGQLSIEVSDNGRGGADPSLGSGLRGLADRVAASGGRLAVTSSAGVGTIVSAVLPLA
jgi:signal transduction histidine kinase